MDTPPKSEKLTFIVKPNFEDVYDIIYTEISKKSHKWKYKINYMDFDDVKSIIITHIYKKWHLYDHTKPLLNWVNTIISNQMINIARDNYTIHLPPCASCACNIGDNLCSIYTTQSSVCPLYEKWEREKKSDFNINVPVSMESHSNEVNSQICSNIDFENLLEGIKEKAKLILTKKEYLVFDLLYLQKNTEKMVAAKLKYKNYATNGKLYSKQIENIKKSIFAKAQKIIFNN